MRQAILAAALGFATGPVLAAPSAPAPGPSAEGRALFEAIANAPEKKRAVVGQASVRAAFCVQCHAKDGNSARAYVPKIAGQNPLYILEQLEKFADGRRQHYVMAQLARNFSGEDMVGLTLYFTENPMTKAGADPKLAAKGKPLYDEHCAECHGADGRGVEGYARIAGQQPEYMRTALRGYRDKALQRRNALMEKVAADLDEREIDTLSAYIANLD